MIQPRRGEVWWVEVPDAGRRPALVLTRSAAIPHLNRVLVAPATRTVRRIPTEVQLDGRDGMPASCALTFDNLTVVRKTALGSRVTRLSRERMAEVCTALQVAVGCPAGRLSAAR
ncbi:MAG TPA: type II toxin-antitoxin system PemK/MazF family toxin [Candidatus Dormibacteraeota bacterium]